MRHYPCDICIDHKCGEYENPSCNCAECESAHCCPKLLGLSATIRITDKCTQSCAHCCFSCTPKSDKFMSITTATNIAKFLKNNPVHDVNLMGGEIYCHPRYKQILEHIIPSVKIARVVSNGDWADDHPAFADFLAKFENVYVSLSKDRWHTNKHVEKAVELLKAAGVTYKVETPEQDNDKNIVPAGRGELVDNFFYSTFACYCHNPEQMYNFMINETGEIFKCGFEQWNYAKRFKEFHKVFHDTFIPSCAACIRCSNNSPR